MEKKKILLIDDEINLCKIIKLNLENSGEYEVETAFSGEEGLEKAGEADFDLVITDFKMPGMDGKAVLETLKEMRSHTPVVLFSVYHDDAATIDSDLKIKADGLISKPFDIDQLHEAIRDALARSAGAK